MIDIKINLSIELPGAQMIAKEECSKLMPKDYKDSKGRKRVKLVEVEDWDKMDTHSFNMKDKDGKNKQVIYHTRKSIPARQSINISTEAYNAMVDNSNCPEWERASSWRKASKKQRVASHMQRIAESLGGKVIEFTIFED